MVAVLCYTSACLFVSYVVHVDVFLSSLKSKDVCSCYNPDIENI